VLDCQGGNTFVLFLIAFGNLRGYKVRGSGIVYRGSGDNHKEWQAIGMKIRSYKDLDVWKKGIEIVDLVYEVADQFPDGEKNGLASHIQKTAISIPSNIAEGFARQHTKEYIQFCYIALGSCAELETQLFIARRRNYVSSEHFSKLEDYLDHESRMLMSMIKSLKR